MTDPSSPQSKSAQRRRGRFWLNFGEVVAVLAVLIAGLNYWEAHREHSAAVKAATSQAKAQAAFVLTGAVDAAGRRLVLQPLKATQAIQWQRYRFPGAVLDKEMEIASARPQIDADWLADGLARVLDAAGVKGNGEALLPVAITTAYVEDGETRTDRSLYQVGYAYRSRFLIGRQITLQGLSLVQRGVTGNPRALVEQRWKTARGGIDKP